jgi:hypothetical protein
MKDELINCIVGWMALLWILLGVSLLGLGLALLKGVLLMFGIETNL